MWAPPKGNTCLHELLVNREGHLVRVTHNQIATRFPVSLDTHSSDHQHTQTLHNNIPKIRRQSQIKTMDKQNNQSARVTTPLQVTPEEMSVKGRRSLKDV